MADDSPLMTDDRLLEAAESLQRVQDDGVRDSPDV
jgi:hypothetical protein